MNERPINRKPNIGIITHWITVLFLQILWELIFLYSLFQQYLITCNGPKKLSLTSLGITVLDCYKFFRDVIMLTWRFLFSFLKMFYCYRTFIYHWDERKLHKAINFQKENLLLILVLFLLSNHGNLLHIFLLEKDTSRKLN